MSNLKNTIDGSFWDNPQTRTGHIGINVGYEYVLTLAEEYEDGVDYYEYVESGIDRSILAGTWSPTGEQYDVGDSESISVDFAFYFFAGSTKKNGEGISKAYSTVSIFYDFDGTNGLLISNNHSINVSAKLGTEVENSAAYDLLERLKYEKVSDLVLGKDYETYDEIIANTHITNTLELVEVTEETFEPGVYYYYKKVKKGE